VDDPLILLVTIVVVVVTVYALYCAWDMRRLYGHLRPESLLWDRLVRAETRAVIAGVIMLALVLYGLVGFVLEWAPIPRPWSSLALAAAYLLLIWGPIEDRRTMKRIREEADR
jgi:Na+/H+ antiporter NhaD/arsenite permease-like protein